MPVGIGIYLRGDIVRSRAARARHSEGNPPTTAVYPEAQIMKGFFRYVKPSLHYARPAFSRIFSVPFIAYLDCEAVIFRKVEAFCVFNNDSLSRLRYAQTVIDISRAYFRLADDFSVVTAARYVSYNSAFNTVKRPVRNQIFFLFICIKSCFLFQFGRLRFFTVF